MKTFILIFKLRVVYSSDSSFTISIPMNIKTKKISIWVLLVIRNRNTIHMIRVSVIFSDVNNLFFFVESRIFFLFVSVLVLRLFFSDMIKTMKDPIKTRVKPIFRFRWRGLKRKTTPIIISGSPMMFDLTLGCFIEIFLFCFSFVFVGSIFFCCFFISVFSSAARAFLCSFSKSFFNSFGPPIVFWYFDSRI